jgi:hypothetical protein
MKVFLSSISWMMNSSNSTVYAAINKLSLPDVFDAHGKALDRKYFTRRCRVKTWSVLIFPQENPPTRELKLWEHALYYLAPRGRPQNWLGRFVEKGHTIWE